MPLLSDRNSSVLRALGLWRARWKHPQPALLIFDRCGREVGRLEGRSPLMRPKVALLRLLRTMHEQPARCRPSV